MEAQETLVQSYVPLKRGLNRIIPWAKTYYYSIMLFDQRTIKFDSDELRNARRLGELIKKECEGRRIPWKEIYEEM